MSACAPHAGRGCPPGCRPRSPSPLPVPPPPQPGIPRSGWWLAALVTLRTAAIAKPSRATGRLHAGPTGRFALSLRWRRRGARGDSYDLFVLQRQARFGRSGKGRGDKLVRHRVQLAHARYGPWSAAGAAAPGAAGHWKRMTIAVMLSVLPFSRDRWTSRALASLGSLMDRTRSSASWSSKTSQTYAHPPSAIAARARPTTTHPAAAAAAAM